MQRFMRLFNVVYVFFSIGGDKAIDEVDTLASKFFFIILLCLFLCVLS